jgi:hypothetical protein
MGSRFVAVFLAFFMALFLHGSGFAAQEPARSAAAATSAAGAVEADALASSERAPAETGAAQPDEPADPAEAEVEGSTDLPDLVQHLADGLAPAPSTVRPGPHPVALWQAPVLDGLRRPPRRLAATA